MRHGRSVLRDHTVQRTAMFPLRSKPDEPLPEPDDNVWHVHDYPAFISMMQSGSTCIGLILKHG